MKRLYPLLCLLWIGLTSLTSANPTVELRWMVWGSAESMELLKAELKNFERAHPHVRVNLENANSNYFEKLLVQAAAGVGPDVAMMSPTDYHRFAKRGVLLPLDDFIRTSEGFRLDEYYPRMIEACRLDDKLFLLPRDIAPVAFVYTNKEIFRRRGLPIPDGTWTWDYQPRPELRSKCFTWVMSQLQERDPDGKVITWPLATNYTPNLAEFFIYSYGGRYADSYDQPTRMLYDQENVVRPLEFLRKLTHDDEFILDAGRAFNSMQTSTGRLFSEGKIAMYLSGIWDVPFMRNALKPGTPQFFDWDIVLAPAFRDRQPAYGTGGSGYSILSSTRHPKEAWALVRWMAGVPGQLALAKGGDAQPAIRRLARSEPWIPGLNTPTIERFPQNRIITDQAVDYVVFGPRYEYWNDINNYAMQKLELIYNGTSPVEQAVSEGNRNAQRRLDLLRRDRASADYPWIPSLLVAAVGLFGLGAWVFASDRKRSWSRRQRKEAWLAFLFVSPWLVGLVAFTLGPMLFSLMMSFADWDTMGEAKWRGLLNYQEAFQFDPRFWTSLRVTFVYGLFSVPLGLVFSLALALLLNIEIRGMPFYRTCYYLPSVASTVAASLIWQKIFGRDDGLLNLIIYGPEGNSNPLGLAGLVAPLADRSGRVDWLGNENTALISLVIMSLWGVGASTVILLASLQNMPKHYHEAATLDGAGPWRKLLAITLPLISPALFFSLITGVIGSFQVFTQAFVMTAGGPNDATMFYMLHLYNQAFLSLRMGYASSLAWILFVIILVFTAVQLNLRRFVHYEGESR